MLRAASDCKIKLISVFTYNSDLIAEQTTSISLLYCSNCIWRHLTSPSRFVNTMLQILRAPLEYKMEIILEWKSSTLPILWVKNNQHLLSLGTTLPYLSPRFVNRGSSDLQSIKWHFKSHLQFRSQSWRNNLHLSSLNSAHSTAPQAHLITLYLRQLSASEATDMP